MAPIKRLRLFYNELIMEETKQQEQSNWKRWFKRIGMIGFLFFLIKGLLWIGVAVFVGKALFD